MEKIENRRRLVKVSKSDGLLPVQRKTLYHWSSRGRYPGIFAKVGRSLCVDLDAFDKTFPTGGPA